ncbi:MAG: hypothetical protein DSY80_08160 [Desulfocapsa sp.]|nr:MAG: hypothetical protein DSY80_08160 [Desulfocapsa sp.]
MQITLEDVKRETARDDTLQTVIQLVRPGRWHEAGDTNVCAFRDVQEELTVSHDGLAIIRDTRLVIPTALQKRVIELAHEGHQGISKTKSLIRSKVWFPLMDTAVEESIGRCIPCQANYNRSQFEPLNMSKFPRGPWVNVCIDFCGPLPSGEYLLVVTDEYSRYPVVEIVRHTSAEVVIQRVDEMFALFGFPEVIKSDNGPPFQGHAWSQYVKSRGIRHRKITPQWPKANAQVENFNKPLMKAMKCAHIERRD